MAQQKYIELINQVFVEKFELDPADLAPEKRIFEDLELDSLDIVDLVAGLQHKFGIQLRENKDLLQIRTMQDIYDLFEKLIEDPSTGLKEKIENL